MTPPSLSPPPPGARPAGSPAPRAAPASHVAVRPFVLGRAALHLLLERPLAPLVVALFLFAAECALALVVERAAPRAAAAWLAGRSPASWVALCAVALLLASALLWPAVTLALGAALRPRVHAGPRLAASGVLGWCVALGTAAALAAVLAAGGACLRRGLLEGHAAAGAALWALAGAPALLLSSLLPLAGCLAAARLAAADRPGASAGDGLAALGEALLDLLAAPRETVALTGALGLLTLPLVLVGTLAGIAATWTPLVGARLALLAVQALCLGFALAWAAIALRCGLEHPPPSVRVDGRRTPASLEPDA